MRNAGKSHLMSQRPGYEGRSSAIAASHPRIRAGVRPGRAAFRQGLRSAVILILLSVAPILPLKARAHGPGSGGLSPSRIFENALRQAASALVRGPSLSREAVQQACKCDGDCTKNGFPLRILGHICSASGGQNRLSVQTAMMSYILTDQGVHLAGGDPDELLETCSSLRELVRRSFAARSPLFSRHPFDGRCRSEIPIPSSWYG